MMMIHVLCRMVTDGLHIAMAKNNVRRQDTDHCPPIRP